MKAWVYRLNKEQLAALANSCDLDDTGSLEELRKRLHQFAENHPEKFEGMGEETNAFPRLTVTSPGNAGFRTPTAVEPELFEGKAINQIRKWGCHFDGRDPAAFLERVEELRGAYGFTRAQLLQGLPELLRGDTLLWFRNYRGTWGRWEDFERDFRQQYLPRRYAAALRREIMGRHQKSTEKFAPYVTVMMTLMRRAGGYSREEQLDLVYENMHPAYKHYIRIDDVRNMAELQARATEYEDIIQEQKEALKREKPATSAVITAYNRKECCWRCKQRGHTRAQCQRPAKKFCSQCGRDGVLTKECHPRQGNANGAEAATAAEEISTPS